MPPARRGNSFPGRELAGTIPPPETAPPRGFRHVTSGAILDHPSSRCILQNQAPLILPAIWPKPLASCRAPPCTPKCQAFVCGRAILRKNSKVCESPAVRAARRPFRGRAQSWPGHLSVLFFCSSSKSPLLPTPAPFRNSASPAQHIGLHSHPS